MARPSSWIPLLTLLIRLPVPDQEPLQYIPNWNILIIIPIMIAGIADAASSCGPLPNSTLPLHTIPHRHIAIVQTPYSIHQIGTVALIWSTSSCKLWFLSSQNIILSSIPWRRSRVRSFQVLNSSIYGRGQSWNKITKDHLRIRRLPANSFTNSTLIAPAYNGDLYISLGSSSTSMLRWMPLSKQSR